MLDIFQLFIDMRTFQNFRLGESIWRVSVRELDKKTVADRKAYTPAFVYRTLEDRQPVHYRHTDSPVCPRDYNNRLCLCLFNYAH